MQKLAVFFPFPGASQNADSRFDQFLEWAKPFGSAGFNSYHAEEYHHGAQYYEWSSKVLGPSDNTARSWLLKQEYLDQGRAAFGRARKGAVPEIKNEKALIDSPLFLRFAKAYINVIASYRHLESPARSLVRALAYVEKALRDLNSGESHPKNINAKVLDRALVALTNSDLAPGKKYDIGKELEVLAGMLQNGYRSKTFRFQGKGFRLLQVPFTFASPISSPPRKRTIEQNTEELTKAPPRLTSEHIAAVGLAYRRSIDMFGEHSLATFFSAIAGLSFTTVSMRRSDAMVLRRDSLYRSSDSPGRCRIRIARPKTGMHQDLPIPAKLSTLAEELFQRLLDFTSAANEALAFYEEKFSSGFDAINDLYIPQRLQDTFSEQFLTVEECYSVLGIRLALTKGNIELPQRLKNKIEVLDFVEHPGDISDLEPRNRSRTQLMITISAVKRAAEMHSVKIAFPDDIDANLFIGQSTVLRLMGVRKSAPFITELFEGGQVARKRIRSADLKRWLLDQFKSQVSFPHWPFIDKDSSIRVSSALLVWFQLDSDGVGAGENKGLWWLPSAVNASVINRWLSRSSSPEGDPFLFVKTGIRLRDGTYPSLTLHDTRKYHHTEALLAGAHEVFIDELAGRKSGRQSDHYDLRSPHEILAQSIETFDPDTDFDVIGPVAEQAKKVRFADRRTFLYENAAPKHITDIGGCSTDWSLEPCKQYGDCTRCDQQVWRKGDVKRLQEVQVRRDYTISMISKAETKIAALEDPSRPILMHYQQFKDDLVRYDAILAVEADEKVEAGTIVTFAAPSGVMNSSDLAFHLRSENLSRSRQGE